MFFLKENKQKQKSVKTTKTTKKRSRINNHKEDPPQKEENINNNNNSSRRNIVKRKNINHKSGANKQKTLLVVFQMPFLRGGEGHFERTAQKQKQLNNKETKHVLEGLGELVWVSWA